MKTVNIFLFLVLTIILAIIVGLTLSNKFNNKEEFVTKVLPPTSEPRCIRSNLEEETMTRKTDKPPCFFNGLDDTNKNLIGLNALVRDRTDDIIRKSTMIDDNLYNRATEGSKKIDLILRGDDLTKFNQYMRDTNDKMADNKNKTTKIISQLNTRNVAINESSTINKIQLAVSKLVSKGIDRIISSSSENMGNLISKKFKPEHANEIIDKLTVLIYDKINNSIGSDINDMVNNLVETKKLDEVIAMSIENAMREDKTYAAYMSGGNNNIKIGDFVYFKHRVNNNNPDLCIDNISQREIIVGGKVCDIDPLTYKAKINYLFTANPNFNERCAADPTKNYAYDRGVAGLPKWYVATSSDQSKKCGPGPFKDAGCLPNQWPISQDAWVRQYVGGFDRDTNEMSCGVGPTTSNDYPTEVNILNLSKSLEDIVNSCKKTQLSYSAPSGISLPKAKYNPSKKYMLPMPKYQELPQQLPKKTPEQLQRERMEQEAERRIAEEDEVDRKELEDLQRQSGTSGVPMDLTRRTATQIALEEQQRPQSQTVASPNKGLGQTAPPPSFSKQDQTQFNRNNKGRDDNDLINRCINANQDDSKEDRYLIDSSKNRFRIVKGQIMKGPNGSTVDEADLMLPLPNNVKVSYLFRKDGAGNLATIYAYGNDKKWYYATRDARNEYKFLEVTDVDLKDVADGEIDKQGSCVVGNKI